MGSRCWVWSRSARSPSPTWSSCFRSSVTSNRSSRPGPSVIETIVVDVAGATATGVPGEIATIAVAAVTAEAVTEPDVATIGAVATVLARRADGPGGRGRGGRMVAVVDAMVAAAEALRSLPRRRSRSVRSRSACGPARPTATPCWPNCPKSSGRLPSWRLQGMGAVRQRVREENTKAVAEGRAEMPEASVMKIAEELLPKLRLAEWLDRAEAALRQMEHLDLRDLRSVVAASGDPTVARDEGSTALVAELKAALADQAGAGAAVVVRRRRRRTCRRSGHQSACACRHSHPKAGVPFPVDIAQRLVDSVNASLAPMDSPERWSAMLEGSGLLAGSRSLVKPARKPDEVNDDLLATVKRLAPALPQIAAMFEIEVDPKASMPKPLRSNPRQRKDGEHSGKGGKGKAKENGRRWRRAPPEARRQIDGPANQTPVPRPNKPQRSKPTPPSAPEVVEAPAVDHRAVETPPPRPPRPSKRRLPTTEVVEAAAVTTEVVEAPAATTEVVEAPRCRATEAVEAPAVTTRGRRGSRCCRPPRSSRLRLPPRLVEAPAAVTTEVVEAVESL